MVGGGLVGGVGRGRHGGLVDRGSEGPQGGVDGRVEVLGIDGAGELVTLDLLLHDLGHLGEGQ